MKKIFNRYILGSIVGLALLAGCKSIVEEPEMLDVSGGLASLTIDMSLPIEVQTKSISADPLNSGGTWTEWEKFVDGSLLYNLTLLVVDSDNRLVGYRFRGRKNHRTPRCRENRLFSLASPMITMQRL